jgi:hypothetical protein
VGSEMGIRASQVEAEEIAASSSAVSPWFSMVGMVVTCRSDGWAWVEVGV